MTYGDLYNAIPLWVGAVGAVIGIAIITALVVWRRLHPIGGKRRD